MSHRSRLVERFRSYLHRRAQTLITTRKRRGIHRRNGASSETPWCGLEQLEPRVMLDAVAWTGLGDGVSWSDANNWDTVALPGMTDDVTIIDGADPTIVFDDNVPVANRTVGSLVSHEAFDIQSASLTVSNQIPTLTNAVAAAWFTNALTLSGGSLIATTPLATDVRLSGADLSLQAGQLQGAVISENIDMVIGAAYTEAFDITVRSFASTLSGDLAAGQLITVLGEDAASNSHAVLSLASGVVNAGTIRLNTTAATSSASLDLGTHQLSIASGGLVDVATGLGGSREIRGTGTLVNQGDLTVEGTTQLTILGVNQGTVMSPNWVPLTYESAGGVLSGPAFFDHTQINVTASPTTETTLQLVGFDNTLISDNLANTTLVILGADAGNALPSGATHSVLELSQAVTSNSGTIRLDTIGASSSNLELGANQLINTGSGTIEVMAGAGGVKEIRGTGRLTNQGDFAVEETTQLTVIGINQGTVMSPNWAPLTYESAGGVLSGPAFFDHTQIDVTAAPASETIIQLVGFDNTLISDNLANTTVVILGADAGNALPSGATHSVLELSQAVTTNSGTIRFDAIGVSSSNLDIGANQLINDSTGVIDVVNGVGGVKELRGTGRLTNQGALTVATDAFLTLVGINQGTQLAPNWAPLTYEAAGGTITGPSFLNHTQVDVTASAAAETSIQLVGSDNTLISDNLANTRLVVLGSQSAGSDIDTFSHAVLSLNQTTTNNFGEIVLTSQDILPSASPEVASANLDLLGNTLVNVAAGTISVETGESTGRFIKNGTLDNQGTLQSDTDLEFLFEGALDPANFDHTNSGTFASTNGATVIMRGNTFTNQSGGAVESDGTLQLIGPSMLNQGAVRPGGDVAGSMAIIGDFTQDPGGSIELQVGGTNPGTDHDEVTISADNITVNGDVVVSQLGGFTPAAGDRFEVAHFSSSNAGTLAVQGSQALGLEAVTNPLGVVLRTAQNTTDFSALTFTSYSNQDAGGTSTVEGGGSAVRLTGNTWKKVDLGAPITITADTILEFDFQSSVQGEFQGIGFDTNDVITDDDTHAFVLYGTQPGADWARTIGAFRNYGDVAPDWKHYRIRVGDFFTGTFASLTFFNDHDVAMPTAEAVFANVKIFEETPETIDFDTLAVEDYGITGTAIQDSTDSTVSVSDVGRTLSIVGNGWKKIRLPYTVTANTVLEFDYTSSASGDFQGIGFDTNDDITDTGTNGFLLYGTQAASDWDRSFDDFRDYADTAPATKQYRINVGEFFTGGVQFMTFFNDHDVATPNAESIFSNVRLFEDVDGLVLFDQFEIQSYSGQDSDTASVAVEDNGQTLSITGNAWKKIRLPYTVTANTVLEFDYTSTAQGEFQGIGFDVDDNIANLGTNPFVLYGTQTAGPGSWAPAIEAHRDYADTAPATKQYRINVGDFFTGDVQFMTFFNDHDVATPNAESIFSNVRLFEAFSGLVFFDQFDIQSYSGQDTETASVAVEDNGQTLNITGNGWKKIRLPYTVTANTVLEFDYTSTAQGDFQGIGFDDDDDINNPGTNPFVLYGTQAAGPGSWAPAIEDHRDYADTAPATKQYRIDVGEFFTGDVQFLTFFNDHDVATPNAESIFSNVRLFEAFDGPVLFDQFDIQSYSDQDTETASVAVEDNGQTLNITGNAWKKIRLPYMVTANTVLEFDYTSTAQGDFQGIGFDVDDNIGNPGTNPFVLYGTQAAGPGSWDPAIEAHRDYADTAPAMKHYRIEVGTFFGGSMKFLTFFNDHDVATPDAESVFTNVTIFEDLG